jgi:SAM-dependent methyltransferase
MEVPSKHAEGPLSLEEVDDEGIALGGGVDFPISLFFDEQRIWSTVPSRDGHRLADGRIRIAWPAQLRPYLSGRTTLSIRRSNGGPVLCVREVAFATGDGRVSVVDSNGAPLTVDKAQRLNVMFSSVTAEDRRALVLATQQVLDILNEYGVVSFLAYGCLLGAVRDGRLIGHDSDADVSYVASSPHPFDVIRESLAIERHFRALGWRCSRLSGADFKVHAELSDGTTVGIDVFTAFYRGQSLYIMPCVSGRIPMSSLTPLSTVELEGVSVTAPADPATVLEATYGSAWRTPDPSFKYKPSQHVRRFLSGVMRGERRHQRYWNEFYAHHADAVPTDPSPFARWVAERESPAGELLDIGSGTGRDTLWFSSLGFRAVGCDYARAGVAYAADRAREGGLSTEFCHLNLYDVRHVLVRSARFAHDRNFNIVYARFLVHAIEEEGRRHLWLISRSALVGTGGRLYLEFRTEATQHEFGEHFRQFVGPDRVVDELQHHGFEIEHCETRTGLAVHKNEDPRVCRITARM